MKKFKKVRMCAEVIGILWVILQIVGLLGSNGIFFNTSSELGNALSVVSSALGMIFIVLVICLFYILEDRIDVLAYNLVRTESLVLEILKEADKNGKLEKEHNHSNVSSRV